MANVVTRSGIMIVNLSIFVLSALACVHCSGEFIVLHAPNHVSFQSKAGALPTSEISDVISSSFGYQLHNELQWDGLGQGNLFKRPKASVVVSVAGMSQGQLATPSLVRYPTLQDDPEVETETLVNRIESSVDDRPLVVDFSIDNTVLDVRSHHPGLFTSLPTTYTQLREVFAAGQHGWSPVEIGSLNYTQEADLFFMGELYIMKKTLSSLQNQPEVTRTRAPDFFHFRLLGMQRLLQEYGKKSTQMRDALNLLQKVLEEVTQGFRTLYKDNIVVQVVALESATPSASHSRKSRSLLQEATPTTAPEPTSNLNLAPNYTSNYPIVFNLILWTMVVIALSVLAIAWGLWNMDPGRDSIIYRMTSQRIKKD